VQTDVWSVTSYNELRREALGVERWNRLHPSQPEKVPYILETLQGTEGPIIAASDYMKVVPDQLSPWLSPGWCRWARMALAAATIVNICAATSR
jgi:pyruvate dehydrogenase E1 component